jgi:hypothetical protein
VEQMILIMLSSVVLVFPGSVEQEINIDPEIVFPGIVEQVINIVFPGSVKQEINIEPEINNASWVPLKDKLPHVNQV